MEKRERERRELMNQTIETKKKQNRVEESNK